MPDSKSFFSFASFSWMSVSCVNPAVNVLPMLPNIAPRPFRREHTQPCGGLRLAPSAKQAPASPYIGVLFGEFVVQREDEKAHLLLGSMP